MTRQLTAASTLDNLKKEAKRWLKALRAHDGEARARLELYTTITDRTPEVLSEMDSLERVTFDACHGLTSAGVARLARLPRLRELRVSGKGVTSDVRRISTASERVLRPVRPVLERFGLGQNLPIHSGA
jgi:hypothetical protein